jgi:hypothetical protein
MDLKPQRQLNYQQLSQCPMLEGLEQNGTIIKILLAPRSRRSRMSRRKPKKSTGLLMVTITFRLWVT